MNFSESAAKLSAYFPESSGSGDDEQFSKSTNQPALSSPDDVKGKTDPDQNNESMVYDLEEFEEAKKDWIKNFFYSRKNGKNKQIGIKENDNDNSEKKELKDADAPTNKIPQPDKEVSFLKGQSELNSRQEHTAEELQKNVDVNSVSFKRIRTDLKAAKKFVKSEQKKITQFVATKKKISKKQIKEMKLEFDERTDSGKKSLKKSIKLNKKNAAAEVQALIESNKQVMKDYIAPQKDIRKITIKPDNQNAAELHALIESNNQEIKDFIASQKDILQNKSIKPDNQNADELQALIESNKQVMKDFIASQKDILQNESIKRYNQNAAELHALVESNKQEMKDFIASQKDILQSYIDFNKIVAPPQPFRNIEEIKASIRDIPVYSAPVIVPETLQQGLKKSPKILLAEDDLLLRKSLSFYLSHNGFDIVQVTNGLEAMEEIYKTHFDVIILDLQMPHMGGLEIIDRVRNQLHLDTKIIVLTASGVEEVELKSFSMGATDFIAKPFSPSVVKARIEKLMAGDAE